MNREMDTSGARFMTTDILHITDIPWQLPASASVFRRTNSALVTLSSGQPYPATYPRSVLAVLGLQEAVQLVTQRAREAQNDPRETARRATLQ